MAARNDYSQNRKLYVGTSPEVSVGDDNAIIQGRLGIGSTSAPSASLDVFGETGDDRVARFESPDDGAYIQIRDNDTLGQLTVKDGVMAMGLGGALPGSTMLNIIASGNVGVGTTGPISKLQVKGDICLYSENTSSGSDEIDKIIFKKSHPSGPSTGYYELGEIRSKTYGGYSGGLNFYTNRLTSPGSYASTFAMAIDNFGRVGIGTTDPGSSGTAQLHVCNGTPATYTPNSEADTLVLESSTPGGISLIGTGAGGNAKQAIVFGTTAGPSSASIIYDGNNSKLTIGTTSVSQFVNFSSGNSLLALTLDAAQNATFTGDVGLGGTGLYTALHSLNIDGTGLAIKNDANGSSNNWSSIRNTATASSANFVFTTGLGISLTLNNDQSATFSSNLTTGGQITVPSGYSVNIGTSRIHSTSTSYLLGGNVGIGVTVPSTILHVAQTSNPVILIQDLDGTNQTGSIGHNGGDTTFVSRNNTANGKFTWYGYNGTTFSPRMTIIADGNVGIGTTDPQNFKLRVDGTFKVDGSGDLGLQINPSDGTFSIGDSTDASDGAHIVGSGTNIKINISSNTKVTFNQNGTQVNASTITATNFILSSDERLKENIKTLKPKVISTKWRTFNVKDSDEGHRVGVIAQELEVKHPEFVETNEEGFKSVKYIDLLISKIAELEHRIKQLEK